MAQLRATRNALLLACDWTQIADCTIPKKAIETTKPALAEFIKEQRPNDPEPIVWDVSQIANQLGAEIIDEIPLCSGGDGPMVLKTGTKEGKEYRGWVCPTPKSGHPAKWMRIGSDGHWVFQK